MIEIPFAIESFLLIFCRLSGLFISAPILSSRQIPVKVKILVISLLAGIMAYFIPLQYAVQLNSTGILASAIVLEVLIGYTLGFVAYIVFAAIQLAGQVMDMEIGFAIVNVVDPQSGMQIPLMGNLTQILALLMYLAINGHHYLLQAIVQSYQVIPVMGLNLNGAFYQMLVDISIYMFVIAVKIAAPILVVVLTTDIAMGFIARTVPQMNVFIVGLPLKILVGLGALGALLPVYIWFFDVLFMRFFEYLDQIIIVLGA